MTYHEKLDIVLSRLAAYNREEYGVLIHVGLEGIPEEELPVLLEHLMADGFATAKYTNHEGNPVFKSYYEYRITLKGLLFLEKSSYKSEINKEKRNKLWTSIKIIGVFANAVLLLMIGIAGIYIADQSNSDKEENKKLQQTVDSLRTELIKPDQHKIDTTAGKMNSRR